MSPLEQIMGTEEAAKLWGITQDYVKMLCREKKVQAVRIGKTWVMLRNQDRPIFKR